MPEEEPPDELPAPGLSYCGCKREVHAKEKRQENAPVSAAVLDIVTARSNAPEDRSVIIDIVGPAIEGAGSTPMSISQLIAALFQTPAATLK